VVRKADGTISKTTTTITLADQAEEKARRAALLQTLRSPGEVLDDVVLDTSCEGSSVWLYDEYGETGDEICFYMNSNQNNWSVYLGDYSNPSLGTWAQNVLSAWPGVDEGCLSYAPYWYDGEQDYTNFAAWGAAENVTWQWTNYLALGLNCRYNVQ
jgi:hypothetical protein